MTKIFIWLSRVSLKKVKREIFDFLNSCLPDLIGVVTGAWLWEDHHSLISVSRSQFGPFCRHSHGWWLETNQVHFYAYFPLTFLSAGLWPGLGVSSALESQLTRHRNVLLLAPPRPVLVTGVKSVQINFMILTAHNARQRTGKILATILPIWEDNSQEGPRAILIKRMKCGGWVIISRVSHLTSIYDHYFMTRTHFSSGQFSCVVTFTGWFTRVSQQFCKLNWSDLITLKFNLPSQSNLGKTYNDFHI